MVGCKYPDPGGLSSARLARVAVGALKIHTAWCGECGARGCESEARGWSGVEVVEIDLLRIIERLGGSGTIGINFQQVEQARRSTSEGKPRCCRLAAGGVHPRTVAARGQLGYGLIFAFPVLQGAPGDPRLPGGPAAGPSLA